MKIQVKVKPNSKHETVVALADGSFEVRVNAPPIDGKANERVIELLAKHLKVPKSHIQLVRGSKGKLKVFEVV